VATFQKRGKRWRAIVRRRGHSESKSFPTKAAAEEWARRIEHTADLGHTQQYKRPTAANTVAWMIEEYTKAVGRVKPFGRSKSAVLDALTRDLGDVALADLTAERLNEYVADRIAAGAGGVTISVDLSYLATAMRWLQAVRRFGVNIQAVQDARDAMKYAGVDTRSRERDRRPAQDELDALFSYWRNNERMQIPMMDICQFAIASAMRLSEICRLAWPDLNENKRTIVIRDRKDPRETIGNNQIVPLLNATGYNALEIVKRQPKGGHRIFPYNPKSISTAFTRAVKKCGIDDLRLIIENDVRFLRQFPA